MKYQALLWLNLHFRTVLLEEATIVFGVENDRKSRKLKLDKKPEMLTTLSVDKDNVKRF